MPGQSRNAEFFVPSAMFQPKYVRAKQKSETSQNWDIPHMSMTHLKRNINNKILGKAQNL